MKSALVILFGILLHTIAVSCTSDVPLPENQVISASLTDSSRDTQAVSASVGKEALIDQHSFAGIKIGTPVSSLTRRLTRDELQHAKGSNTIYWIDGNNSNESLAYIEVSAADKVEKVFGFTVISPQVVTPEGISVGSTLAQLRTTYPSMTVHGSEIDSHVTAFGGNYFFRIDAKSDHYELPADFLDDDMLVLEIYIR